MLFPERPFRAKQDKKQKKQKLGKAEGQSESEE